MTQQTITDEEIEDIIKLAGKRFDKMESPEVEDWNNLLIEETSNLISSKKDKEMEILTKQSLQLANENTKLKSELEEKEKEIEKHL